MFFLYPQDQDDARSPGNVPSMEQPQDDLWQHQGQVQSAADTWQPISCHCKA